MAFAKFGLVVWLLLLLTSQSMASSQFQGDFALSIIETDLFQRGLSEDVGSGMPPTTTEPFPNNVIFNTDPFLLRGDSARYDAPKGQVDIFDDGTYVFIIHRVGRTLDESPLILQVYRADDEDDYIQIGEIFDNGEGVVSTTHALAQLKRGDIVSILNEGVTVIGDEDNPFIFNMFLLYHTPITSFPHVRQSAFKAFGEYSNLEPGAIDNLYLNESIGLGGFDEDSGVFKVPIRGPYIFNLAATFIGNQDIGAVDLKVNGDVIARCAVINPDVNKMYRYGNPVPGQRTAAITIPQSLEQGDEVNLFNVNELSGDLLVKFIGYLLS